MDRGKMGMPDQAIRYPVISLFKFLLARPSISFCKLALALVLLTSPAQGATLRAGVAKVDITPPVGMRMWGYGNRKGPSTGVLDPLYARVLVLEAGDKKLALVALDLGRPFGPVSLTRLREAAQKSSGISYLLVVASHTHSGPVVQDEYPPGATPAWESSALDNISRAIGDANADLVEARLGVGTGATYIGHNRLRVNSDGTVTWFERNLTQVPTAPVDPTNPDLTQMTALPMTFTGGTTTDSKFAATIDNPNLGAPSGTVSTIWYVIAATDADDAVAGCSYHTTTTALYSFSVTQP